MRALSTNSFTLQIQTGNIQITCQFPPSRHWIRASYHPKHPLDQRICSYCSNNAIDDEFHFVMNCSYNKIERDIFLSNIPPYLLELSEDELFVHIFSNSDEKCIKEFGKYIYESFLKRNPPDTGLVRNSSPRL